MVLLLASFLCDWREKTFCVNLIFKNVLRLDLWPILENAPSVFEENVYSVLVGKSVFIYLCSLVSL